MQLPSIGPSALNLSGGRKPPDILRIGNGNSPARLAELRGHQKPVAEETAQQQRFDARIAVVPDAAFESRRLGQFRPRQSRDVPFDDLFVLCIPSGKRRIDIIGTQVAQVGRKSVRQRTGDTDVAVFAVGKRIGEAKQVASTGSS